MSDEAKVAEAALRAFRRGEEPSERGLWKRLYVWFLQRYLSLLSAEHKRATARFAALACPLTRLRYGIAKAGMTEAEFREGLKIADHLELMTRGEAVSRGDA